MPNPKRNLSNKIFFILISIIAAIIFALPELMTPKITLQLYKCDFTQNEIFTFLIFTSSAIIFLLVFNIFRVLTKQQKGNSIISSFIIFVLFSTILLGFNNSKKMPSPDAQAKSNTNSIAKILENYYQKNTQYPTSISFKDLIIKLPEINKIPNYSNKICYQYQYCSNTPQNYNLQVKLWNGKFYNPYPDNKANCTPKP